MNRLTTFVIDIQNIDNLHIVKFDFFGTELTMMSLELDKNIKIGTNIILTIKPTHITLSRKFNGIISCNNQIKSKILSVNNGKLLSDIKLITDNHIIESIVTLESSLNMNLKKDDEIIMLIEASNLSIIEVLYA